MSRDTFGFLPERFELTTYVARQSLISAGNDASAIRSKLTPLSSAFQQRMVRGDLAGDLYRRIDAVGDEIDLVLIDLVDERSGVVDFGNGTYATKLSEFWGSGGQKASKGAGLIDFGTDEHFTSWKVGAERFADALHSKGLLHRTITIRADWASVFDTGAKLNIPEWMMQPDVANALYARYFNTLESTGFQIAKLPEGLSQTSQGHQWGPSPFHFRREAYEHLSALISSMTSATP